jgi:hypothetical protein
MLGSAEVGRWLWFLPAEPEDLDAFFRPQLEAQRSALQHEELPANAVFVVRTPGGEFLGQGAAYLDRQGSAGELTLQSLNHMGLLTSVFRPAQCRPDDETEAW